MDNIKDIFFDLDRTLWDFERNSECAMRTLFDEFNLKDHVSSFECFYEKYKLINAQYWKAFSLGQVDKVALRNQRFVDTLVYFEMDQKDVGSRMADRYIELSPYQKHLFPGTKQLLKTLKDEGFQLHIITNGFKEVQSLKLQGCQINSFFDVVLCSEEVGKSKPHPAVFHEALSRANAKAEQSIMIGDDLMADVNGAENIGMRGVLFDPNNRFLKRHDIVKINQLTDLKPLVFGL